MIFLAAISAGVAAALLTAMMRSYALARGLLDVPNVRSSHNIPTPHGGGVAIVLAVTLGCCGLWASASIDGDLMAALLGGLVIATVGFVDDRYKLSAGPRLAVHLIVATGAVVSLGGLPTVRIGEQLLSSGALGYPKETC